MILKDKVVMVTGGNQGIGKAITLGLASEGARIVVDYIENEKAAVSLIFLQVQVFAALPAKVPIPL